MPTPDLVVVGYTFCLCWSSSVELNGTVRDRAFAVFGWEPRNASANGRL